jgi:hypothetical protein
MKMLQRGAARAVAEREIDTYLLRGGMRPPQLLGQVATGQGGQSPGDPVLSSANCRTCSRSLRGDSKEPRRREDIRDEPRGEALSYPTT